MTPESWRLLDELRGNSVSRGVWISSRVWGVWRASQQEQLAACAVIYATFRRKTLSSHSCIEIRLQTDCPFERMRKALPRQ